MIETISSKENSMSIRPILMHISRMFRQITQFSLLKKGKPNGNPVNSDEFRLTNSERGMEL